MIVYEEDDSLNLVIPVGLTEEQILRNNPHYKVVDSIPTSRRWRNAWRLSVNGVVVDLDKAKQIRKSELESMIKLKQVEAWEAHLEDDQQKVAEIKTSIATIKNAISTLPSDLAKLDRWGE